MHEWVDKRTFIHPLYFLFYIYIVARIFVIKENIRAVYIRIPLVDYIYSL